MKKKTAWITGGSRGIGFGVAESLLAEGYNVVISGRNPEHLYDALTDLRNRFDADAILGVVSDVRDFGSQQKVVEQTLEKFGSLDILVANAGIGHFANIEELTVEQWHQTIDVNLTGVFYSVKVALDELKKNKGYIITISSLAGTNFFEKGTAYNASKFGLTGFTQALMLDIRQHDVKTTTIMPGSVATYFNDNVPDESDSWKIQKEDIGQMVADLLKMHPRVLPSKIEVRPSKTNSVK
ncbi:SDR family oxidoreductase [Avrilella dinanensis]|uniref:SDR family oxidoreductase n=1 Tax=Avrilella dinanensis TaxID=2008672 RepID=UPI0024095F04|nr:SDR family oxidoreductase [Avrilella dinanensis]